MLLAICAIIPQQQGFDIAVEMCEPCQEREEARKGDSLSTLRGPHNDSTGQGLGDSRKETESDSARGGETGTHMLVGTHPSRHR